MPKLIVVTRDGAEHQVEAAGGRSAMEAIRAAGIDELLAICGGCASCGTCHVHVDGEWLPKLPPMARDEDDTLRFSDHRRPDSRLSCQIRMEEALGGLRLTIAPED